MGFVDLHAHVLPGVDDGPATAAEAGSLVAGLGRIGFEIVCATPHQKADQYLPSPERIRGALLDLQAEIERYPTPPYLVLGAENMWDSCFYERFEAGTIPRYEGSTAFLLEFHPAELPIGLAARLFQLRTSGLLPVIAHPERYRALRSVAVREQLARDCALVVNLPALAGHQGSECARLARALLRDGLAHAVATDSHCLEDVTQSADGVAWIRKKMGDRAVVRLLDENPRRILAGEHPAD